MLGRLLYFYCAESKSAPAKNSPLIGAVPFRSYLAKLSADLKILLIVVCVTFCLLLHSNATCFHLVAQDTSMPWPVLGVYTAFLLLPAYSLFILTPIFKGLALR